MRLLLLLLIAGFAPAHASEPAGSLQLELVDAAGAPIRTLTDGEVVDRGALIRFVVEVQDGSYLTLLQRNNRGVAAIHPSTGLVWMAPEGVETLVPQPPFVTDEERQVGYNGEDDGAAEYLLVVAPAPRPVPSGSFLDELDTFLAGAPYVTGPAAEPAVVVASARMVWGEEQVDPTQPRLGGPDDEPPPGDVLPEEDEPEVGGPDEPEVGGKDDPNPEANRAP